MACLPWHYTCVMSKHFRPITILLVKVLLPVFWNLLRLVFLARNGYMISSAPIASPFKEQ